MNDKHPASADEVKERIELYAERCPKCTIGSFTTGTNAHRCLVCGHVFSFDEPKAPSFAKRFAPIINSELTAALTAANERAEKLQRKVDYYERIVKEAHMWQEIEDAESGRRE